MKKQKNEQMCFEQGLARISEISELLAGGEPELEQSLALYEEACALMAHCRQLLTDAELRITEMSAAAGLLSENGGELNNGQ